MLTDSNFREQMIRKIKEEVLSTEAYNLLFGINCNITSESSNSTELISVIIPTHNRYDMLCRCIDSVLMQTHKQIEVIVMDDNSNDETSSSFPKKYSSEPRIRYYRNENSLGPGGARQKAYLQARGDFVVFIDDDDYYIEPKFFAEAIEKFSQYPNCALVCANTVSEWLNADNSRTFAFRPLNFSGWKSGEDYFIGFIRRYKKPSSSFPAMFKKAALDTASFSDMKMMNDASIYLRALCYGDVYALKMIVGVYYIHASNISKALPFEFIVQNLEEKKNIYNIAKDRNIRNLDKWFRQQIFSTVVYFFSQPTVNPEGEIIINEWCNNNGLHFKFALRLKLLINTILILARGIILKLKLR